MFLRRGADDRSRTALRRWSRSALGSLVAAALLLVPVAATADTVVDTFSHVDSTDVGCTGVVIASVRASKGVVYEVHGHALHLPTAQLPWDRDGTLRITAEAKKGYVAGRPDDVLRAPAHCFTDLGWGDAPVAPQVSWCKYDRDPVLSDWFEVAAGTTVTWRVVRGTHGAVVVSGSKRFATFDLGSIEVPVGRHLPVGRYTLEYRNASSSPDLFPYALRVEQYRCVTTRAEHGKVTFSAPRHGPGASLVLWGTSGDDELPEVYSVRAGRSTTVEIAPGTSFAWQAYPTGYHPGAMGQGYLTVP